MNNLWAIEITKLGDNPETVILKNNISDLGIKGFKDLEIVYIYYLSGNISNQDTEKIGRQYICDPVAEKFKIRKLEDSRIKRTSKSIEIVYKRLVDGTL